MKDVFSKQTKNTQSSQYFENTTINQAVAITVMRQTILTEC